MEPRPTKAAVWAWPGGNPWKGYVVAGAGTAAAALFRWAIGQWVGEIPPFITFYPVAMAAAMLGGTGAGLLATVLSALATDFFFIPPIGTLWILAPGDAAGMTLFVAINILISIVGGRLRAAYAQSLVQAAALASAANAIVVTDHQGVIRWVNPAFERLTGYSAAEAVGQNPRVLNSGKHDQSFFKQMWETIQAGRVWQGEVVNKRKDGSLYTEEMTITPVKDPRGSMTHFIAIKQDVSARKEAEARMRGLSQRLAEDLQAMGRLHEISTHFALQDDLHSLLDVILDAAIAIVGADKGYVQLLDQRSGALGIVVQKGFDPDFVEFFSHIRPGMAACGNAMETKQRVIVEDISLSPIFLAEPRALQLKLAAGVRAIVCTPLVTRGGELLGVLSTHFAAAHRPSDPDLGFLDVLARQAADFIERTQAGEALRESERQFRTLADSMPNLAWWANADGYITWYNRRWYEYTGTTPEQMEGWGWQSVHDPEMLPKVLECWKASIATGGPLDMEFPLRRADGQFRWFLTRVVPVKDAAGKVLRWFGTNTDVSEAREAREMLARGTEELERLVQERTARLRETIEELEGFSYSIVHDMRGPLRAMQSFGQLAQESCAGCERPDSMDFFRRIRVASNRMDQLITDALSYSKIVRQELPLVPVDVGRLVRDMVETYPNLHPPLAEIEVQCDGLLVLGNESALTQVFSNLLGNAVKFVAPGIKPRVSVWAEALRSAGAERRTTGSGTELLRRLTRPDAPPGAGYPSLGLARIWVGDNGIGIAREAHEKIFAMFQRMHGQEDYPGTGIGLTIVRKAMERMGGRVGVESEPGKGSRFWIELDRTEQSGQREAPAVQKAG